MQITDQQFIDAMNKSVQIRGAQRVAPGRYEQDGRPFCIIGYAMSICGVKVMNGDPLAEQLLREHGVSSSVAKAGWVAQILNDAKVPWGGVLDGFTRSLAVITSEWSDYEVSELASRLLEECQYITKIEPSPEFSLPNIKVSLDDYAAACKAAAYNITSTINTLTPAQKKDHALVA